MHTLANFISVADIFIILCN